MTHQEILLQLLEESRKYQYAVIRIYDGWSWRDLENFRTNRDTLGIGSFYTANQVLVSGFLITLIHVPKIQFGGVKSYLGELALTKGQLTTIYQPHCDTLYLCWEL